MAVSHRIEHQTSWIKKFVCTARRYRIVRIKAGRQILTAADPLPDDLREAIAKIDGQLEHPNETSWVTTPDVEQNYVAVVVEV